MEFNITREEVLNLAAEKVVQGIEESGHIEEHVRNHVANHIARKLGETVDKVLQTEMEQILKAEICPVDMWGEKTGKPTTIKEQLEIRARTFWEIKVDENGKESNWSGIPRHQHLYKQIVNDEFSKAIKATSESVVSAFKAALIADAAKLAKEHIDKLIHIK